MYNDRQKSEQSRGLKQPSSGSRSGDLGQGKPPPNLFGRNMVYTGPAPLNISAPINPRPAFQVPPRIGIQPPRYQEDRRSNQQYNLGRSKDSTFTNASSDQRYRPDNILEKYTMKPAPKDQYKKYMQKSENVFYEERFEAKLAVYIKWLVRLLIGLTLLVLISYILVSLVTPYDGPPPKNGYVRNKVIYCDFGYRLIGNECLLDQIFNIQAEELALGVITDLRLQYGDQDCFPESKGFVERDIRDQISRNEQLELRRAVILQEQVHKFLSLADNKKIYKFDYDGSKVWPTEKLHSYTCQLKLFLESGVLWKGLLGAVALLSVGLAIHHWYEQEQLAHRIYDYLKTRVFEKQSIKIEDEHDAMEQIGHVTEKLWQKIDRIRTKEKLIGYFEDESLSWRKI